MSKSDELLNNHFDRPRQAKPQIIVIVDGSLIDRVKAKADGEVSQKNAQGVVDWVLRHYLTREGAEP